MSAQIHEQLARERKALALALFLASYGCTPAMAEIMTPDQWRSIARAAKVRRPPSAETCALTVTLLAKLEAI